MRKTIALLVSVALTGIIGVSAAQAHRAPDRPGCPAAHSHDRGHGHGRGHSRAHTRCTPPVDDEDVTTTTESATTTRVTFDQ